MNRIIDVSLSQSRTRSRWHGTLAGLLMLIPAAAATAQTDPFSDPIVKGTARVELQQIGSNMAAPHNLTHAFDGTDRLFVADQSGEIHLIKNGVQEASPYFSTSSLLTTLGLFGTQDPFGDYDERGLLGLAFHPDFGNAGSAGFGKFYTHTSEDNAGTADFTVPLPTGVDPNHQGVIREWTVDPTLDVVTPTTSREVLRVDQPQFNHNGGALVFGNDGMLYASYGDGGAAQDVGDGHGPDGNGQNLGTVHGSIIRIDPLGNNSANGQYGIPNDNPFVGTSSAVSEVYAYGLRNPFQINFDVNPADRSIGGDYTGDLIVADVGQSNIEEIDIVQSGDNLGWRLKEGSFYYNHNLNDVSETPWGDITLPSDFNPVDPVLEYDHDEGISVIGGFVYRGTELPELYGKYIFGDFSTAFFSPEGRLFYGDLETGEINELIIGDNDRDLGMFVKGFGRGPDGEIYLLAGTNLGPFRDENGIGYGGVFKLVSVPEPGSITLIAMALPALVLRRRRSSSEHNEVLQN